MDRKRKLSGWQNKQNRENRLKERLKNQRTLCGFLLDMQNEDNSDKPAEEMETHDVIDEISVCESDLIDANIDLNASISTTNQNDVVSVEEICTNNYLNTDVEISSEDSTSCNDFYHITDWPENLQNIQIEKIVSKGPMQANIIEYPKDSIGRSFNKIHFHRKIANGETLYRSWLVYSTKVDRLFCFCCKIFSSEEFGLAKDGTNDWGHMTMILKRHEQSTEHFCCYGKWIELKKRLSCNQAVDCLTKKLYLSEVEHWDEVLKRIISIILMLASENIPFRGTSDKLFTENNGNFFKIVELFSKFDPVLEKHVRRAVENPLKSHYLGKNIQQEIILLIAKATKDNILAMVKNAKYFSIIVDCTPDASHKEQMSIVVRYVHIAKSTEGQNARVEIQENFLEFINISDTTGAKMSEEILSFLKQNDLSIMNLRGQGYDNGANMVGKKNGVQFHITDVNPRAFFIPCLCHSLNLVIVDAVKGAPEIITFFSTIQTIYNFFSRSTKRWQIFSSTCCKLTVKSLSDTRWESHVNAVTALKTGLKGIYLALKKVVQLEKDGLTRVTAESIGSKLDNFEFICGLIIWQEVLTEVNFTSKLLQSQSIDVKSATSALKRTTEFLISNNCENSFEKYISEAKICAIDADLAEDFRSELENRTRKRMYFFDEEPETSQSFNAKQKFKKFFFDILFKIAIASMNERFKSFSSVMEPFEFLFHIKKCDEMEGSVLRDKCKSLQIALSHKESKDLEATDLQIELKLLSRKIENDITPESILKWIYGNNVEELFPNTLIALRVLLTLPVSVAKGERSFSKLKLIKNHQRSTMGQSKLNGFAIISIESKIAKSINLDKLRKDFAKMKARQAPFS